MNDSLIEVLGWIGFLFILFGYFLNAIPIMAMSVFILGMNLYGYKNWK